jgi:thiazole tautomerase (transcriptional regulator TenI)
VEEFMIIVGITNRKLCIDFYSQIRKISKSKLNYLIIREKDLEDKDLLELVLKVKEEIKDTDIKLIINSNMDIAEKSDADGIQLSFKDFVKISNKLCGKNNIDSRGIVDNFHIRGNKYKIIGVSIHSYEEGIQACKLGADYVIYGHVFETDCKKGIEPRGLEDITALSKMIGIPLIGIGGINQNNFREVLNAGAKGIAIMSSLMTSQSPLNLLMNFQV